MAKMVHYYIHSNVLSLLAIWIQIILSLHYNLWAKGLNVNGIIILEIALDKIITTTIASKYRKLLRDMYFLSQLYSNLNNHLFFWRIYFFLNIFICQIWTYIFSLQSSNNNINYCTVSHCLDNNNKITGYGAVEERGAWGRQVQATEEKVLVSFAVEQKNKSGLPGPKQARWRFEREFAEGRFTTQLSSQHETLVVLCNDREKPNSQDPKVCVRKYNWTGNTSLAYLQSTIHWKLERREHRGDEEKRNLHNVQQR